MIKATLKTLYNLTRVKVLEKKYLYDCSSKAYKFNDGLHMSLVVYIFKLKSMLELLKINFFIKNVYCIVKDSQSWKNIFNIWRLFWLFNTQFCTFYLWFYFNYMAMLWPWWVWMEFSFGWTLILLFYFFNWLLFACTINGKSWNCNSWNYDKIMDSLDEN